MIRIYDTARRAKVEFTPLQESKVRMYVCGPTVYNYIHIGNARTFISFDMIRRYLEWRGYEVDFVQNITDVDDKIIAKALEEGRDAAAVAQEYTEAFIADMRAAGVKDPTLRPKATEEIGAMIELIGELVSSDHAYATDDGDVYFAVRSFPSYGALSGRNVDEMEAGHRDLRTEGLEDRKRDPLDFALWKAAKPGEPSWSSPWGEGRPGWHIECSTMAKKHLGLPFDIHGGGADLCFPHHENERAQSEAATGGEFAHHWMHGGMLQIDSEKMSKSLGNFLLLREVLETVDPNVLRFLMLQTHYRSPMDYSPERIEEASVAFERMVNAVRTIRWAADHCEEGPQILDENAVRQAIESLELRFTEAMDDDFNSPKALGAIFDFIGQANAMVATKVLSPQDVGAAQAMADSIVDLVSVLGIDARAFDGAQKEDAYPPELIELALALADYEGDNALEAVDALLSVRAQARAEKDWAIADRVRDGLSDLGFAVKDTPQGAQLEYVGD